MKMKKIGIYGIFNTTNNKILVGSSCDIDARISNHKGRAKANKHGNPHFQSAWNKYGQSSFEFRVLEECPEDMLIVREDAWIEYYHSLDLGRGYNMQNASRSKGRPLSEQGRINMSIAKKGFKHTAESRAKMSLSRIGNKSNSGRSFSLDHKKNISLGLKKSWDGNEHRRKLYAEQRRERNKTLIISPESIAKQAQSLKNTYAKDPSIAKSISNSMKEVWRKRKENQTLQLAVNQ